MKRTTLILFAAMTALCSLTFAQNTKLNPATHPSIDEMKSRFVNPGRDYATAPLWVWNDLLTDDQIRHTMQDLAAQDVKQVFVHPRPGLMTPYLSEDWFHLWKTAFDEAEKLDMNVWIYDENSYPSGFARISAASDEGNTQLQKTHSQSSSLSSNMTKEPQFLHIPCLVAIK